MHSLIIGHARIHSFIFQAPFTHIHTYRLKKKSFLSLHFGLPFIQKLYFGSLKIKLFEGGETEWETEVKALGYCQAATVVSFEQIS